MRGRRWGRLIPARAGRDYDGTNVLSSGVHVLREQRNRSETRKLRLGLTSAAWKAQVSEGDLGLPQSSHYTLACLSHLTRSEHLGEEHALFS